MAGWPAKFHGIVNGPRSIVRPDPSSGGSIGIVGVDQDVVPVGPPRRCLASPPLHELDQRDEVGGAERLADLGEEPGRRFDVDLADRDPESLAPSIEIACDDSAEDAGRGGRDRVERGERRLLDLMAERGERGDGVLDCGDAVNVGRIATGLRRSPSDAEAAGIGTDLVRERTARRRRGVGIARHRPRGAIEDCRGIAAPCV